MKLDKSFYRKTFTILLPIVFQNLLSSAVSSADVVMLNYVSQSSLSAVSLATQFSSIVFIAFFGLGTGLTMLAAQYWGKGDSEVIEKIEGIALRFSLLVGILVMLACWVCPGLMMRIFTNDEELIAIGCDYLRVVGLSFLLWSIAEIYIATLRSIGRVTISTVISSLTLFTNVGLNAVFIFGLFGAPKLGATGVALATTISRGVEVILCYIVSSRSSDVKLKLSKIFEKNPILLKDFIRMAMPAIGNDISWVLAFSMYSVIMGHLGSDVVAANSIVVVVRNFATVLCFGFANASGIIVGQMLGENQLEKAKAAGKSFLLMSILAGILGGVFVFLSRPFVLAHAALSPTAMEYLGFMLLLNTYYVSGTAVNTTLIAGLFRAGGDSKFGLVCDTIDMWCYAVPLGFLAAFVFKFPVKVVYFLLLTDEFVKWPWVFKNFFSYKWVRNITRDKIS